MPDAVIVDAIRTPIGRAAKGSLKDMRADDLAAIPLAALVDRNPGVDFAQTTDILMGCGFPIGEQGYNVGRNAQLLAGIDHHVPAVTVSRFCSSSLQALRMAFHAIVAGEGDQYVAAGVEAVSRFPPHPPFDPHPRLDGSEGSLFNVYIPMGITAENVAPSRNVSRESQDEWAAISQQRAVAARDGGHFAPEIVPVTLADGTAVAHDDGPRAGTTVEKLAELKPAFKPDGTVTAGNACPLNDGAAAVLVMSDARAQELGLQPRARIVASSVAAIRPEEMASADPGGGEGARAGRHDDRGRRRARAQRGLRRAGRPLPRRVGRRLGQAQPVRRGDRPRSPVRDDRRTHHDDAAQRPRALDGTIGLETMCVAGGMGQAMIVERLR